MMSDKTPTLDLTNPSGMTDKELRDLLTQRGASLPPSASRDDLLSLYGRVVLPLPKRKKNKSGTENTLIVRMEEVFPPSIKMNYKKRKNSSESSTGTEVINTEDDNSKKKLKLS